MTPPARLRARAQVPLDTVHHALTDPGALRTWLAEYADVDVTRRRYVFWGRYTPDGAVPRQRLLDIDGSSLRFSWPLGGEDTTTEISLAEDGPDATLITVTQSHVPPWSVAVAETDILGMLPTFWELAIANLVDYVEGRELTPKCDFTSLEMRGEVTIGAAPDDVYESLLDADQYRQWFGANVDIERRVGGRFAMGGFELDDEPALIVELEPSHKVTLEWPAMVATWELEGSGGGTRLTFVHSGFDEDNPPYGGWLGWLSGVAGLRRFHELPRPDIIWVDFLLPGLPDGMLAD